LDEAMLPSGSWDRALDAQGNGEAVIRIHNTNTAKIVVARFPCRDGKAALAADCPIPGVSGAGVPVALCFLDPGGIYGNGLLPTGQPTCQLSGPEGIVASLIDSAAAGVFLRAGDFGLRGTESPEELEANPDLLTRLEVLRQQASVLMGVTASTGKAAETQAAPKIALVAPAQSYIDISGRAVAAADYDFSLRMISMGDPHRAVPLTGGLCAATGARIPGSLLAEAAASRPDWSNDQDWVRIGTPSGVMRFAATVALGAHGNWNVSEARVERSTRRLMEGQVLIPAAGENGPNDDKKDITT